jgi:hypothetical protein
MVRHAPPKQWPRPPSITQTVPRDSSVQSMTPHESFTQVQGGALGPPVVLVPVLVPDVVVPEVVPTVVAPLELLVVVPLPLEPVAPASTSGA